MRDSEHGHSEATGPGDTLQSVSDMATPRGEVCMVHTANTWSGTSGYCMRRVPCAMHKAVDKRIGSSQETAEVTTAAGWIRRAKAGFIATVLKMRPSIMSFP